MTSISARAVVAKRQRLHLRTSRGLWLRFRGDHTEPDPVDSLGTLVRRIEKRKCNFIENLVKAGTDINGALIHAASRGYKTAIANLLMTGASVNAVDEDGDSPLIVAARNGHENCIEHLIKAGADVNVTERSGKTPLVLVAEKGFEKCVEVMAKLQRGDNKQLTLALVYAASKGSVNCMRSLLQAGADVNGSDNKGFTALIRTASVSFQSTAFLIESGANVNSANNLGSTALMEAVRCRNNKSMEVLLDAGADVNSANVSGTTALMVACAEPNTRAVNLLLDEGVDVNKADNKGNSALTFAVINRHINLVDILTRSGSTVNTACTLIAVENGFNECLKLLLRAGADVNTRSSYGETLLISATHRGNIEAVNLLVRAGADVNASDCYGNTALMAAAGCGAIPSYHLLRKTGAQTRVLSQMTDLKSDNLKLLHMQADSVKCVKLLLEAGIKINQTNKFEENALQYYLMNFQSTSEELAMLLFAAGERLNKKLKDSIA